MEQEGSMIGNRYRVERELGHGGMATVYKCQDIITDQEVSVKIIRDDTMQNPVNVQRFHRESKATSELRHANIVSVITIGEQDGRPFIVNEYINGKTLKEVLDQRGRLTVKEALDAMNQLCSAVLFAHRHGVIHRDIKPSNIFITPDGTIKLADFGIATFMNASHITISQNVVGSVQYMAPEVSEGGPASPQSDIYAMGITLFELITGNVPFDGDSPVNAALKAIKEKFPNIKKFNPDCPDFVCSIIYKCCQKSPLNRYQSVYDLQKDIEKAMAMPLDPQKKKGLFGVIAGWFHKKGQEGGNSR